MVVGICCALLATVMVGDFHQTFFSHWRLCFSGKGVCSLSRKGQDRAGGSGDGLVDLRLCTQQMCVCMHVCVYVWLGKKEDLKLAHNFLEGTENF